MTPVNQRAIILNMMGGNVNPFPILLLVNYWELRPTQMGSRLDELLRKQVTQFATFIPWQAVESDISHTLTRFLQAVADRRMNVYLIITPELGLHYPNAGLPKDIAANSENKALHSQSGSIITTMPPNFYSLPSLFAPEMSKRYYNYLTRMDSFFADLNRFYPDLMNYMTIVLTGSYWKYYRSPTGSSHSPFSGMAGDYSSHASLAYRQRIEQFFSHREFLDPNPSSANRWKVRSLEEINRKWFYQQSEDTFKTCSYQMIRRKSGLSVAELELYTPEADPGMAYSQFLQMMSGGHADFSKLSKMIDEASYRCSYAHTSIGSPFIHWSTMGGVKNLTEPEKQFLVLKSLLLLGGQGGGLLIDEAEWFNFSSNFRNRAEAIGRALKQGELQFRNRALYLTPNLWSNASTLWDELSSRLGASARMVASLNLISKERFANLLVVDPSFLMTQETVHKLITWARAGRVLVLPKNQLYTESARVELEKVIKSTQGMEVDLGLTYHVSALGDGKLVVYDVPDRFSLKGEHISAWQTFLTAILSLSEIESLCKVSDSRLSVIPIERNQTNLAVFILNGTRRQIVADIFFPTDVQIEDLGAVLSRAATKLSSQGKSRALLESENHSVTPRANRYTLEVPPFGVLPLAVEGLNLVDVRERQLAAMSYAETQQNVLTAANTELPGFSMEKNFGEIWN